MKITDLGLDLSKIQPDDPMRQPIHQKGDPYRFDNFFPLADLRFALATQEWHYPRLRMSQNGAPVPPHEYFSTSTQMNGDTQPVLHSEKIEALLAQGALLVVDRVHEFQLPVNQFALSLQESFHGPAHANLYLARKGEGFPAHFDCEEGFVTQIIGAKKWRLAPPSIIDPDLTMHHNPDTKTAPSEWQQEFVLEQGDFLYLPRGWWHACETVGSVGSCHITFGCVPRTWLDYLDFLLNKLTLESETTRGALPLAGSAGQLQIVLQELIEKVKGCPPLDFLEKEGSRWARAIRPDDFRLLL